MGLINRLVVGAWPGEAATAGVRGTVRPCLRAGEVRLLFAQELFILRHRFDSLLLF